MNFHFVLTLVAPVEKNTISFHYFQGKSDPVAAIKNNYVTKYPIFLLMFVYVGQRHPF